MVTQARRKLCHWYIPTVGLLRGGPLDLIQVQHLQGQHLHLQGQHLRSVISAAAGLVVFVSVSEESGVA